MPDSRNQPVRTIAGAPVKHVLMPIRVEKLQPGVWVEIYANGREVIVTDLTSALWKPNK